MVGEREIERKREGQRVRGKGERWREERVHKKRNRTESQEANAEFFFISSRISEISLDYSLGFCLMSQLPTSHT